MSTLPAPSLDHVGFSFDTQQVLSRLRHGRCHLVVFDATDVHVATVSFPAAPSSRGRRLVYSATAPAAAPFRLPAAGSLVVLMSGRVRYGQAFTGWAQPSALDGGWVRLNAPDSAAVVQARVSATADGGAYLCTAVGMQYAPDLAPAEVAGARAADPALETVRSL